MFIKHHGLAPKPDYTLTGCQGHSQVPGYQAKPSGGQVSATHSLSSLERCKKETTSQAFLKSATQACQGITHGDGSKEPSGGGQGLTRGRKGLPPTRLTPPQPSVLAQAHRAGVTAKCSVQLDKLVGCLFRFQNTWK